MISTEVYGLSGSAEFQAASWLRNLILAGSQPAENGIANLHVKPHMGQQLDVFLHGYFPAGISRQLSLPGSLEPKQVSFLDVIATIEVKTHGRDGVDLSSTNAIVFYPEGPASASDQSHKQALNVKKFIQRECSFTPWVSNLIFFPNLVKADLPPSRSTNYLAGDSTFEDLFEKLCAGKPSFRSGQDANFFCAGRSEREIQVRHEQLQAMLGGFQRPRRQQLAAPAVPHRRIAKVPAINASPVNPVALPSTSPAGMVPRRSSSTSRGRRTRLATYLLYLGMAVLALFLIHKVLSASIGAVATMHSKLATFQQLAQTEVTTCMSEIPSCGWQTERVFRRGMTVYFQFEGLRQDVLSVAVQEPRGKAFILPFHKAHEASPPQQRSIFVARMPLVHRSATGSYSVSITARDRTSQAQRLFTERFTVEP